VAVFIIKRILWTIPVLLLTIMLTFLLVKQLPPPFDSNVKLAPSVRHNLDEIYGLNHPWYVQYANYVWHLAQGDWGKSTKPNTPTVWVLIKDTLPVSFELGAGAFVFGALLGTALGAMSAIWANRWPDYAITVFSTIFFALPIFLLAHYAIDYMPNWSLGWGYCTPAAIKGFPPRCAPWTTKIGPIVVLGSTLMPYFTRLVRASMLETLQQEYVVAARAKGIPWRKLVLRHVVRNSLIPTITSAGPLFGFVVTGNIIIEAICVVPGIGGEYVRAFSNPLDIYDILDTTVLVSLFIILANMCADIAISVLDPRIAHD
jgi:ABC-type dipeptide/oligopeptide/nickel transport system permease component